MSDKRGFIPGRSPHGEYMAIPVFQIDGKWRNANGLVSSKEVVFATEAQAIKAAHVRYETKAKT